jgi:PAS domain S-box-containing protein
MQNISDSVIIAEKSGKIIYVNEIFLKNTGFTEDVIYSNKISDVFHPCAALKEFLSDPEKHKEWKGQLESNNPGMKPVPFLISASSLLNARKEVEGIICSGREITEIALKLKRKDLYYKTAQFINEEKNLSRLTNNILFLVKSIFPGEEIYFIIYNRFHLDIIPAADPSRNEFFSSYVNDYLANLSPDSEDEHYQVVFEQKIEWKFFPLIAGKSFFGFIARR